MNPSPLAKGRKAATLGHAGNEFPHVSHWHADSSCNVNEKVISYTLT